MRSQYPHASPADPRPHAFYAFPSAPSGNIPPAPHGQRYSTSYAPPTQAYRPTHAHTYQQPLPVQPVPAPPVKKRNAAVRSENWKLMSIVVFFLFWMFAGIFFLGLYMDKYLF